MLLAAGFFALGLGDEPFVDEYAYITQSYQPDILFAGRSNDPAWLDAGTTTWCRFPSTSSISRSGCRDSPARAGTRRSPGIATPRTGGVRPELDHRAAAVDLHGGDRLHGDLRDRPMLVKDQPTGAIAAFLLAVSPLYRLHAHRAMSEAACEAFLLLALALGMRGWKAAVAGRHRAWACLSCSRPVCWRGWRSWPSSMACWRCFHASAWCLLGLVFPGLPSSASSCWPPAPPLRSWPPGSSFLALNPFMTAHPTGRLPAAAQEIAEMGAWQRFEFLIEHRRQVSATSSGVLAQRLAHAARAGQGGRRPGLWPVRAAGSEQVGFDRQIRLGQDWGAFLWLPLVVARS